MAAVDMTEFIPSLSFAGASDLVPKLIWIMLLGILAFVLFRLATHRILVETLEYVRGGYVAKVARYARRYDKDNNLEYLAPAFGGKWLPAFPSYTYQKVKGIPVFGVTRALSLIKQNQYSYKVNMPAQGSSEQSHVEYYDTLSWSYIEQDRAFIKQMAKDRLLNALAYIAPLAVIVACFGLLLFGIYAQSMYMEIEASQLTQTLEAVRQSYG